MSLAAVRYRVRLWPHLDATTFDGWVTIAGRLPPGAPPAPRLLLDADRLTIAAVEMDPPFSVASYRTLPDQQKLEVVPCRAILGGEECTVRVTYAGSLRDSIVGFYSSTYKASDGSDRVIATSKFEPTYARQAFPCFDEPAMKANYIVELVKPNKYIALSNMNVEKTDKYDEDNELVKFAESVKMSSYLACFIVCDFVYKEMNVTSFDNSTFPFRVYATESQIEKVQFSLEFGKRVTEYYINYFKIKYPLPKLDMIAIPDFVSGAMEHWGLVTYRETNLLYDKNTTSTGNLQNIARVVAHEISHMWFGNLVTMKWWNDLWLNEGFASYMQYKACDALEPEWKMLEQFLTANSHSIYALDGTLNSHPIVQTVETPDEITAIFDGITYNKGAAVIRMLEGFVGSDIFEKGVTNYLNKHAFGNTVTQDLLDELEAIFNTGTDKNITYIMDTWTRQMGLPVVNVKKAGINKYTLTQKRFLANPDLESNDTSPYNYKWYILITYRIKGNETEYRMWFPDTANEVTIELKDNQELLKINNDQIGYYRVNYETDMWEALKTDLQNINKTELTSMDRAHLLNDAFQLAESGEIKYDLALEMSIYLKNEVEYVPWSVGASTFSSMKIIMSNSDAYIEFRNYVRGLLTDIYDIVENQPNSTHAQKLLKSTIYDSSCSMGLDKCLTKVETDFKNYLNNNISVDPDLKTVVYYYGIEKTGESEWQKLWNKFIIESDAQERTKMMNALAGSKDPSILNRYLNLAWNEQFVRAQDHLNVIQYIANNPVGTPLVWDHVRQNWDRLVGKFTLNSRTLGTMIPGITRSFATPLKLKEMQVFFEENPNAGAGQTARKQALERVQNNIKWIETHEPIVSTWLMKVSGQI